MSFADPLVLAALLAIPLLAVWYRAAQRRRGVAAAAFVTPILTASVAPHRPGGRRHLPMLAFACALAALIVAAARPQRSVSELVTDGAVMLANDTSSSMSATDVTPSREAAARRAATQFVARVPSAVEVGVLAFSETPILLQSPSPDHALTERSLAQLPRPGGHTAVGVAILAAMHALKSVPRVAGKLPPGAIVLISDGTSNAGVSPLTVAREAKAAHIPVYTVSVGTSHGTLPFKHGSRTVNVPVPVSRGQLAQIASLSGGRAFAASDAAGVSAAYTHLAAKLGHRQVKQEITASFAGAGLALLLLGSALSLRWFGRLA
jgi:Ca-activated chloride channel family protein